MRSKTVHVIQNYVSCSVVLRIALADAFGRFKEPGRIVKATDVVEERMISISHKGSLEESNKIG
jgi:hypothetical protein